MDVILLVISLTFVLFIGFAYYNIIIDCIAFAGKSFIKNSSSYPHCLLHFDPTNSNHSADCFCLFEDALQI